MYAKFSGTLAGLKHIFGKIECCTEQEWLECAGAWMYGDKGRGNGKSCSPSFHYIWVEVVHCELTKGEMGRCGSFKDNLSHRLTNLALHVAEGIIAGKHKWKLMSFLIEVSWFYLTKQGNKLCHFLQLPSVTVSLVFCNCTPAYSSMVIGNESSLMAAEQYNQGNCN